MKNRKMKLHSACWVFILYITGMMPAPGQPAPVEDPHRGVSVDKFLRLVNTSVNAGSPQIDTANSILSVDKNNDGIYEKEVELIQFCNNNHITQLNLYDAGNIFREYTVAPGLRQELKAWDEASQSYQYIRWHFCRFIQYAKSHGIREVMVSLSATNLARQVTGSAPNKLDSFFI